MMFQKTTTSTMEKKEMKNTSTQTPNSDSGEIRSGLRIQVSNGMDRFFPLWLLLKLLSRVDEDDDDEVEVKVSLERDALMPTRGSNDSAGYDLSSMESFVLLPRERRMVSTGVRFAIPENYYGRIAGRSGMAHSNGVDIIGGVIDSDYRGIIRVLLINHSATEFHVEKGDKIAQILFEPILHPKFVQTDKPLDLTKRNENGFGSSDKKQ